MKHEVKKKNIAVVHVWYRNRPGIMYVLGKRKPFAPGSLAVIDEDAEILFKPLICLFGLAISLGVIGGAYILFDIQNAAKFSGEVGGKAGVLVSNCFVGDAIVWENMLDIEVGDGGSGVHFMTGDEDGSF